MSMSMENERKKKRKEKTTQKDEASIIFAGPRIVQKDRHSARTTNEISFRVCVCVATLVRPFLGFLVLLFRVYVGITE